MLHTFEIGESSVRLWQNNGETYEHVLLKALGYAMFRPEFPNLVVEQPVGLRYKPDLISVSPNGGFDFWGECGINSLRKTAWILKHGGAARLVLFKIMSSPQTLIEQMRSAIPPKYRHANRLCLINFAGDIANLTASKQIATVSTDWYESFAV